MMALLFVLVIMAIVLILFSYRELNKGNRQRAVQFVTYSCCVMFVALVTAVAS